MFKRADSRSIVSLDNLCSHVAESERLDFSSGARALDGFEVEMATIATNATVAVAATNSTANHLGQR